MYYRICPYCGSHNDPGERCDCQEQKVEAASAGTETTSKGTYATDRVARYG
ncbi:hypothetical protein RFF05_06575 [Bengtsoniella intestinalis]|uniref:hypothetical protein n=1 Tax=Bengtsoniella intestinalis TaxID=3073143 RepID=UPI00391FAABD